MRGTGPLYRVLILVLGLVQSNCTSPDFEYNLKNSKYPAGYTSNSGHLHDSLKIRVPFKISEYAEKVSESRYLVKSPNIAINADYIGTNNASKFEELEEPEQFELCGASNCDVVIARLVPRNPLSYFIYFQVSDSASSLEEFAEFYCVAHKGQVPPKPFQSDGCTLWPDGDYYAACVVHDIAYWCGGSYWDRVYADRALASSVGGLNGSVMWLGVRAGQSWILPTYFRWGHGWPWPATGAQ